MRPRGVRTLAVSLVVGFLGFSGANTASALQTQSVFAHGDAGYFGSTGTMPLNQLMVGIAGTPSGQGYWTVASDGGIFAYGDAPFLGSMGGSPLNQPMVGMASTRGNGYWTVASDGGVFSFGDAQFYGSTGGMRLNQPVVGMAATPDAGGYWLVARDGGIFAFGDAQFFGSTGAMILNQPVVGMAATRDGGGYWLVARDGGIFAFGDAPFYGSAGGMTLNQPAVGMASSGNGGYWLVFRDGGIFTYGPAGYFGSEGASGLSQPVVGMAATPDGGGYWIASSGVLRGPANVGPLFPPGLPGEGQWVPSARSGLYTTFLRPAPGASPTYLAWMSGQQLRFALYAGTDQPTGNWPNQWVVPPFLQPSLVAAFNSGFQLNQSQGGWYENGVAGVPLANGAASLVIYQDGSATVGQWGRDVGMSPNVYAVRQNLRLLIDNGQIPPATTNTSAANVHLTWGLTLGGVTNTWRSGLCVDGLGNLIYAAGPGLDPPGLARVMQAAGCIQAMELDINPQWPIFVSYPPSGPADLEPGFYYPPDHFTNNINERDFIAAFAR